MNPFTLIHVLAMVVVLALPATARAVEAAAVPSAQGDGIAEARELIRVGRFKKALEILLPLPRNRVWTQT